MIIQKEPGATENVQQFQPPPPSYSEVNHTDYRPAIPSPEPAHAHSNASYPPTPYAVPEPSPYFPSQTTQPPPILTEQQRQAELGRQYQDQLLARCAAGQHESTTTFGVCGIVSAILLFPIGLICLCIDTESKCSRCGTRL